jgi:hypothetical protein
MMKKTDWGIPALRADRLASVIPTQTYAGGVVDDPATTLFLWRSVGTEKAKGATLSFFLSDNRLESLWARPEHYAEQFVRYGIGSLVEVDYSLWQDAPLVEQLWNTHRQRSLARRWQERGILVAPCLNWSGPESFEFCFSGVPSHCPLAYVECRTASSSAEDRHAFSLGLHEAIRQVRPRTLVIYGGVPNEWWIKRDLPAGATQFVFLESWTDSRGRIRKAERRHARAVNQPELFQGGMQWADEDHQAA